MGVGSKVRISEAGLWAEAAQVEAKLSNQAVAPPPEMPKLRDVFMIHLSRRIARPLTHIILFYSAFESV